MTVLPGVEEDTAAESVAGHIIPEPDQVTGVRASGGAAGFVLEGEEVGTPFGQQVDPMVSVLAAGVRRPLRDLPETRSPGRSRYSRADPAVPRGR